jgi:hypothetical protein
MAREGSIATVKTTLPEDGHPKWKFSTLQVGGFYDALVTYQCNMCEFIRSKHTEWKWGILLNKMFNSVYIIRLEVGVHWIKFRYLCSIYSSMSKLTLLRLPCCFWDMLTHHLRFSARWVQQLFPKAHINTVISTWLILFFLPQTLQTL